MAHAEILAVARSRSGKSDRRREYAERDARVRASLAETILGNRCLSSCQRLFDYSTEVRDGLAPAHDALLEAAEEVLTWTQRVLSARRLDEPLVSSVAFEIYNAQWWARHAHNECHGRPADVKAFEVAVADGQPLAICMGTSISFDVSDWKFVTASLGDTTVTTQAFGCLCVFVDTTQTARRMWRPWCDRCTPNKGQRRRAWETEMKRRTREWNRDLIRRAGRSLDA